MKNLLIVFTLVFYFFFNIANSNNKIVFVNMDAIFSLSKPGSYIMEQLTNLKNENIKNFEKKTKKLKIKEEEILKQKNILSPEDFQLKFSDLKSEIKNYNEYREGNIKEFEKIKNNSTTKLLGLINPILTQYSSEKSISMILQKKNLIIGKAELDITKEIIDLVDKNIKKFKIK